MDSKHLVERFGEALQNRASSAVEVMIACRKLLEAKQLKKRYPTAWLYGNWVAHPKLDRDKAAIEILKVINRHVARTLRSTSDHGVFEQEAAHLLSMNSLRSELISICDEFAIRRDRITDQNAYLELRNKLLHDIRESSIKPNNKVILDMHAEHPNSKWVVAGLRITNRPIPDLPPRPDLYLVIDIQDVSKLNQTPKGSFHLVIQ